MTILVYANNAKTTLASPISGTQTTITVAPGTGSMFPAPTTGQAFKITLVAASSSSTYEVCLCTSRTGDVLTIVRGQEGTSGIPFVAGDTVGNFDTKGTMADLVQSEQLQAQTYQYAVATGTSNALAATVVSNLTAIPDGMYMTLISASANIGPATLQLTLGSTVVGTFPIVKGNNGPLVANDIPAAGYPLQINWSASYSAFVLQNPATGIFVAAVPTGAIVQFPCSTAPSGYLLCNGQLVSRITYAYLWAFAQSSGNISATDVAWQSGQFSPGDGTTTFRLPQYGGYFLRSLDNGNGIDPSRTLGSAQSSQNQSHSHTITDDGHAHSYISSLGPSGFNAGGEAGHNTLNTSTSTTGIIINNSGGSEARPINVSVLTCIKY